MFFLRRWLTGLLTGVVLLLLLGDCGSAKLPEFGLVVIVVINYLFIGRNYNEMMLSLKHGMFLPVLLSLYL